MADKFTPGPWRIKSDAQGPCMVMHPTLKGVAIASSSSVFQPINGMHDPADDFGSPCADAHAGTTWRSERVANVRLIAAAPEMYALLQRLAAGPDYADPDRGMAAYNTFIGEAAALVDKVEGGGDGKN